MKRHFVVCRSGDGPASLEVRIKAEEEVLAEAFRAAEVSRLADPPHLEPCEPLSPVSSVIQSLAPAPPVPQAPPAAEPHLVPVCDQKPLLGSQAAIGQRNTHTADLKSAEQLMRSVSLLRNSARLQRFRISAEVFGKNITSQTCCNKHLTCICLHKFSLSQVLIRYQPRKYQYTWFEAFDNRSWEHSGAF